MPITRKHELKLRALVFFADGDLLSRSWCNEEQCNHWIDLMITRYGIQIVASDIIPNT